VRPKSPRATPSDERHEGGFQRNPGSEICFAVCDGCVLFGLPDVPPLPASSGVSAIRAAKFALQSAMGVYSLDYQMYHHFPPPLESARDLSSPLHRGPSNLAQAWHQYHVLHTNEYAGLQRLQSTKCMGDLRLQSHPRQQRDTVRCDTAQNQAAEARAPHQAATLSSASS